MQTLPSEQWQEVETARQAALDVLLHNANGPYQGLPRTAGWGYPEPYTRDLLISILGIAVTGNQQLFHSIRTVLETLAQNQTPLGHMPSLVHDKQDRGSSDSTPLFLLAVGIFRKMTGETEFLQPAVDKALTWMAYQCPSDQYLVAQQPTSDWRDEQWVLGYGLFVNTLVYSYLRILDHHERAAHVREDMNQYTVVSRVMDHHLHEGFAIKDKPYYALWSYKVMSSERFDLLGNSIAILSGLTSPSQAYEMVTWIETECAAMREKGDLVVDLPPNFFAYTNPEDTDWHARYAIYNNPGEYHNGGIWPFICGFYVAALVAAGRYELAEEKLLVLTELVKISNTHDVAFGFNEWVKAQTGKPTIGQDWQTWSASMYLYAVKCVELRSTPFFDEIRHNQLTH